MTTDFMARALDLARARQGATSPNPWVGAVIVRDGEIVGGGATEPPGGRHAEVIALAQAGDAARGADLYVTLEPCSFQGRTGPCTQAIVDAGIARVFCAMRDEDARARGRGFEILRQAGIRVETGGQHATEAEALLEPYSHQRVTGRPFVTAKFAVSLDGKIAAVSGDSRWVSSEESRALTHAQRARVDAILVGSETVVVDNPQLTARPGGQPSDHQPLRVVLDARGRVSAEAAVFSGPGFALVLTSEASPSAWRSAIEAVGEVEVVDAAVDTGVDPASVLDALGRRGVLHLLLEGGGRVDGSFFDAGLVDKVWAIIAPLIIGGEGRSAVVGAGAYRMADAWRLDRMTVSRAGPDVIVEGYPTRNDS
ncbi:MAG: bifunctional diaminohydroxyphosphoribosylaminopyrimidine deaminase/5-amino-6-(5-phosphoribosylamino)uracil reductase RibD [Dehalococcoidia bacterium]|nr:bifunctional diaminohydroxyphosphoribosylaminopyrimidine deaminase/5-amino-6-(5-phosphoribosylamino)uracil reductase RibD [Dehalococcoidia bacterium]